MAAEIVDLAVRRARPAAVASQLAEAKLAVERALHDVLMSIHSDSDSRTAIESMACALVVADISVELFAEVAQLVINRMLEQHEPDGAA